MKRVHYTVSLRFCLLINLEALSDGTLLISLYIFNKAINLVSDRLWGVLKNELNEFTTATKTRRIKQQTWFNRYFLPILAELIYSKVN